MTREPNLMKTAMSASDAKEIESLERVREAREARAEKMAAHERSIERLRACTCDYPIIRLHNAHGHANVCPTAKMIGDPRRKDSDRDHAPRITLKHAPAAWFADDLVTWRIVGCSCGWQPPPGSTDSDSAIAAHVALMRLARSTE